MTLALVISILCMMVAIGLRVNEGDHLPSIFPAPFPGPDGLIEVKLSGHVLIADTGGQVYDSWTAPFQCTVVGGYYTAAKTGTTYAAASMSIATKDASTAIVSAMTNLAVAQGTALTIANPSYAIDPGDQVQMTLQAATTTSAGQVNVVLKVRPTYAGTPRNV